MFESPVLYRPQERREECSQHSPSWYHQHCLCSPPPSSGYFATLHCIYQPWQHRLLSPPVLKYFGAEKEKIFKLDNWKIFQLLWHLEIREKAKQYDFLEVKSKLANIRTALGNGEDACSSWWGRVRAGIPALRKVLLLLNQSGNMESLCRVKMIFAIMTFVCVWATLDSSHNWCSCWLWNRICCLIWCLDKDLPGVSTHFG